jgi:hypothetical protein
LPVYWALNSFSPHPISFFYFPDSKIASYPLSDCVST